MRSYLVLCQGEKNKNRIKAIPEGEFWCPSGNIATIGLRLHKIGGFMLHIANSRDRVGGEARCPKVSDTLLLNLPGISVLLLLSYEAQIAGSNLELIPTTLEVGCEGHSDGAARCDSRSNHREDFGSRFLIAVREPAATDYGQMAQLVALPIYADVNHVTPLIGTHSSYRLSEFHTGSVACNEAILHG
jgi:hypothetical protein